MDNKQHPTAVLHKEKMNKMKGQAIPLFGYHLLRDYMIREIAGEHQGSILYWAGKNLAALFDPQSVEEIREIFLEMGWGFLERIQANQNVQRYTLESPFFRIREVKENEEAFALECGFLTEAISSLEQKDTEGEFTLEQSEQGIKVLIQVYVEERADQKQEEA